MERKTLSKVLDFRILKTGCLEHRPGENRASNEEVNLVLDLIRKTDKVQFSRGQALARLTVVAQVESQANIRDDGVCVKWVAPLGLRRNPVSDFKSAYNALDYVNSYRSHHNSALGK